MDYLMLRNFDQTGYYETRLILMIVSLAVASYFFYYKQDRRFLIMFGMGVGLSVLGKFLATGTELNSVAPVTIFNLTLPVFPSLICQGVFEGSIAGVFAFWYADLRSARAQRDEWKLFYALCGVVLAMSFVVGIASRGHAVTWERSIFAPYLVLGITLIIFVSLMIAWRKDDISSLASYFAGLLLFVFLNYEPMHLLGARYIGEQTIAGPVAAGAGAQIIVMLLSHIFEAAGGKLHYFMLPYALGWVALREREERSRERFSTQHLADLASRGYRKKASKFTQDK